MAHAQRLTEQVKNLTSRVHELETILRETGGNNAYTIPDSTPVSGSDDEDIIDIYETIGSLSIGPDGQSKYHGESASSEVRTIIFSRIIRLSFDCLQYLQSLLPVRTYHGSI